MAYDRYATQFTDKDGNVYGVMDEEARNEKAPAIFPTASGAIASFPDGADGLKLRELNVAVDSVQDLHGYDAPWPAGGGANKLDPNIQFTAGTYKGLTLATSNGYNFTLTGTATEGGTILTNVVGVGNGIILPAGEYIGANGRYELCKEDGTFIKNQYGSTAFTVAEPFYVNKVYLEIVSGQTYNISGFIGLTSGSTGLTAWSPYSNICPISGHTGAVVTRTGKNLLDKRLGNSYNQFFIIGGDMSSLNNTLFLKAGTYTVSVSENVNMYLEDHNQNRLISAQYSVTSATFTNPEDQHCKFSFASAVSGKHADQFDYQLELGSTATAYEPYQGLSVTIPFGQTVYGGTLDPVKGELIVDRAMVELTKDSNWSWNTGNLLAICPVSGAVIVNASNQSTVFVKANMFTPSAWVGRSIPEYSCGIFYSASYIFVRSANHIASLDDLKTVLGNDILQVVYKLATPLQFTLDSATITTLLGTNNIFADSGDVSVTYPADTKLYVDNKIAQAIAAALNA